MSGLGPKGLGACLVIEFREMGIEKGQGEERLS